MRFAIKIVVGTLVALLVTVAIAGGAGSALWSRGTRTVLDSLLEQARTPVPVDGELPAPVRRYLDRADPGEGPPIRVARIHQTGEFLLSPPDGWAPFSATQLFTVEPPGMLWDATIRMAPFVSMRVRDSYVDGTGSMHGAILGLVTVLKEGGSPRMAEATLARYLAEAPWFPTRLRPSPDLRWEPVDDSTAIATLRDGAVEVSLTFRFDTAGVSGVRADRRFRGKEEEPAWAPWEGRFHDYRERDGVRIPTRAEVFWVIDGEERPYWRGTIESAAYEY